MISSYGRAFRISIWGASHSPSIGVEIEGIPAGTVIDTAALGAFMERRAPGRNDLSTSRREPDLPEFVSGVENGVVTGGPVRALIRNTNVRSRDYETVVPRPGHADWPSYVRFGEIPPGGGEFSGRMTAPLCIAGGLAKQLLAARGIAVSAKAVRVGGKTDPQEMTAAIAAARDDLDSVGGVIEAEITGLPVGIGGPLFEGLDGRIAEIVFGIPAVKGVEFGAGFAAADLRGSENNDAYRLVDGVVKPVTNRAGGVLGGLSTGEPLVFRVAMKPTPSIYRPQESVDLAKRENAVLEVRGRHDPCVALRAVPCVEAAAAVAALDVLMTSEMEVGGVSANVYLYGPPGSGKSTVGRLVAERCGREFLDLDAEIERTSGMKISEIFAQFGEPEFRRREREALDLVGRQGGRVVALGGGCLVDDRARQLAEETGKVVFLECDLEVLVDRVRRSSDRPLLAGEAEERLRALLERRKEHYASFPIRVKLQDGDAAARAQEVMEKMK